MCRREKRKERKQQRRLDRPSDETGDGAPVSRKRLRRDASTSSLRLVVDCSFDELMMLKVSEGTGFVFISLSSAVRPSVYSLSVSDC